jgi:hypothetical protein
MPRSEAFYIAKTIAELAALGVFLFGFFKAFGVI